uniref:Uncharacterized protein n=1 Tax=Myoviridae sp. ctqfO1 TaxID=2827710 RepID=A0A8S5T3T1_9CAUD|nr:MAG TPA: hypothetical protein [Myoviridae sp. ctqfO1]
MHLQCLFLLYLWLKNFCTFLSYVTIGTDYIIT